MPDTGDGNDVYLRRLPLLGAVSVDSVAVAAAAAGRGGASEAINFLQKVQCCH